MWFAAARIVLKNYIDNYCRRSSYLSGSGEVSAELGGVESDDVFSVDARVVSVLHYI